MRFLKTSWISLPIGPFSYSDYPIIIQTSFINHTSALFCIAFELRRAWVCACWSLFVIIFSSSILTSEQVKNQIWNSDFCKVMDIVFQTNDVKMTLWKQLMYKTHFPQSSEKKRAQAKTISTWSKSPFNSTTKPYHGKEHQNTRILFCVKIFNRTKVYMQLKYISYSTLNVHYLTVYYMIIPLCSRRGSVHVGESSSVRNLIKQTIPLTFPPK